MGVVKSVQINVPELSWLYQSNSKRIQTRLKDYFSELLAEDFSPQHKTSNQNIACVTYDPDWIYPVMLAGIFSGNLYSG